MLRITFSNSEDLNIPFAKNIIYKENEIEGYYLDDKGELGDSFIYQYAYNVNDIHYQQMHSFLLETKLLFELDNKYYELHPDYSAKAWGIYLEDLKLEYDDLILNLASVFDKTQAICLSLDLDLIDKKILTDEQRDVVNILIENRNNFLLNYNEGNLMFKGKLQQKLGKIWPFPVTDKDIISIIKELIKECKENLNNEFYWEKNDLNNRAIYSGLMYAILNFIQEFKVKVSKHKSLLIVNNTCSEELISSRVISLIDIWKEDAGKETKLGLSKVIAKLVELEFVIYDYEKLTWVKKSGNKKDDVMRSLLRACINNNWLDKTLFSKVKSGKHLMEIINKAFNSSFKYDRKFRSGEFYDLNCLDDELMNFFIRNLPINR